MGCQNWKDTVRPASSSSAPCVYKYKHASLERLSDLLKVTQLVFTEKNTNLKEHMHPYVHCSIIYNSQDLEAAQLPISR